MRTWSRWLVLATFVLVPLLAVPAVAAAAPRPFTGLSCDLAGQRGKATLGAIDRSLFSARAVGTVRAIMLFADTADGPHTEEETTQAIHDSIAAPAIEGFRVSSGGKLRLRVDAVHQWLRIPGTARSYDQSTYEGQRRFMQAAATAAASLANFRGYTHLYVVQAGARAHFNSPAFISAAGWGVSVDGVRIRYGATFGKDALASSEAGSWILMHETGHTFGLPDLYSYPAVAAGSGEIHPWIGSWDVMGDLYGHHGFSQWSRRMLGWLTRTQVVCISRGAGGTVTLKPQALAGGKQLIVVPTSRTSALAIERRAKLGIDVGLCDAGVVVTRINTRTPSGRGPMRVIPASTSSACGTLGSAPFARGDGERCWLVADRVRIEVVAETGDTSTVRVRPSSAPADPRVRSCA